MSLGPVDSATRIIAVWAVSTATVTWFSADFATRKPREINPVFALLVAFAANVSMLTAIYPDRQASVAATILFTTVGIGLVWAQSILLQLLQDIGYRFVGAKQQPIRWYRRFKTKPRSGAAKHTTDAAE